MQEFDGTDDKKTHYLTFFPFPKSAIWSGKYWPHNGVTHALHFDLRDKVIGVIISEENIDPFKKLVEHYKAILQSISVKKIQMFMIRV